MRSTGTPSRLALALGTVVGVPIIMLVAPFLLLATLAIDIITRRALRLTRVTAMALNYAALEWIGIIVAGSLWLATGFGAALNAPWSRQLHYRVQVWWASSVFGAAERWLGLEAHIDGLELIDGSPLIVASQHASFFDALVPTIVLNAVDDRRARHVLKRELGWDPCLAVFGNRHANHFVTRGSGEAEVAAIEALAATAGDDHLVIFPEGTFHSPARAEQVRSSLARHDPERLARLDLHALLPPRPGGIMALLRGRPESAIVFISHTGFEAFGSFESIVRNVPFSTPVKIKLWRVDASDISSDPKSQIRMVDDQWLAMDRWISSKES